jgi:hypothetical protein
MEALRSVFINVFVPADVWNCLPSMASISRRRKQLGVYDSIALIWERFPPEPTCLRTPRTHSARWAPRERTLALRCSCTRFMRDCLLTGGTILVVRAVHQEAFRLVDFTYVRNAAQASHAAGIPYFAHVTASNSSSSSWFLYPKTKGEAEDAIKAIGFDHATILRPGLLDRGEDARSIEKFAGWFVSGTKVRRYLTYRLF